MVALTFDDGPHPVHTKALLRLALEYRVKFTFFVIGNIASRQRDLVREMHESGHEIGNHSWSHRSFLHLSEKQATEEVRRTHDLIEEITCQPPRLFRPPFGALTQSQRTWIAKRFNYRVMLWNIDPEDWKRPHHSKISDHIIEKTSANNIILAHDIYKTTIDAFPAILSSFSKRHFLSVTATELVSHCKSM